MLHKLSDAGEGAGDHADGGTGRVPSDGGAQPCASDVPPKANYRLHTLPSTLSAAFFTHPEQKNGLSVNGNTKGPEYAVLLRKRTGAGGLWLPDFRRHYKAIAVETLRYWHKDGNTDQWNKIAQR